MMRQVLVLDGAMGTYLESFGVSMHPSLWSAEKIVSNPDELLRVHSDYITAGADIITTASYQVSYDGFANEGYTKEDTNYAIKNSIIIARRSLETLCSSNRPVFKNVDDLLKWKSNCPDYRFIAASIGTYGAHLANGSEYSGRFGCSVDYLREWHREKFLYVSGLNPDFLAIETIPCLDEARAIIQLIGDNDSLPISWISIACSSSSTLNSGETVEDFCRMVEDSNLSDRNVLVGVNCTHPSYVTDILSEFEDFCSKSRRYVVYPNRGDIWDNEIGCYEVADTMDKDDDFVCYCSQWLKVSNLCVVGGCCRTHPSLIHRIKCMVASHDF